MRKKPTDAHVMDGNLRSVTRIVWRFYLWPVAKWADNPTRLERRWGWQRVEQSKRYVMTDGWPPKVVGTYWDEGIWA